MDLLDKLAETGKDLGKILVSLLADKEYRPDGISEKTGEETQGLETEKTESDLQELLKGMEKKTEKQASKTAISKPMVIHATRDSVCMGDDCTAPNPGELYYGCDTMLSAFMKEVERYVPNMPRAKWTVYAGSTVLGYLHMDADKKCTIELAVTDRKVADMNVKKIFCRYTY